MEKNIGTEILESISDFQEKCPVIHKESKSFTAKYVGLTKVDSIVKPLLRDNGLIYTQFLTDNSVNTTIWHVETGQYISASFEIPSVQAPKGMNGYQNIGSGITYIRRYALCSALGVIADEDKDAVGLVKSLDEVANDLKECQSIDEITEMFKNLSSKIQKDNKIITAFANRKNELE